jgi:hypothetical protein
VAHAGDCVTRMNMHGKWCPQILPQPVVVRFWRKFAIHGDIAVHLGRILISFQECIGLAPLATPEHDPSLHESPSNVTFVPQLRVATALLRLVCGRSV